MISWSISTVLLTLLLVMVFACRHLRSRLRQEQTETARLRSRLSEVRRELAEINKRRKKLLAASTQALVIVEHDCTISSANKTARRLFGGKPDKTTTLMAWTRQHQLQELIAQVFQGKKMPPLYFNLGDRILEAHARSIKQNKEIVAAALAIHDVTELQRLSRARREFVANISHELRTPLASIRLLIETLLDGALEDQNISRDLVNKIAAQVDTLNQLAQELLDLSLIETGQTPLKMGLCSLQAIVQTQVERLLPQAERKNIALNMEIDEGLEVLVDETMIGRVITNLLHNAIKFTETGSVTISAKRSNGVTPMPPEEEKEEEEEEEDKEGEDWVTVSISDTGIGIPPDEIPRIFERFYKVDPSRSPKQAGTGLGLAIAKHIVEAHGGRIWAENRNQGTAFYFTLLTE
jgi:two-component system phosphate regulon sensor histidine kinase PhoR